MAQVFNDGLSRRKFNCRILKQKDGICSKIREANKDFKHRLRSHTLTTFNSPTPTFQNRS